MLMNYKNDKDYATYTINDGSSVIKPNIKGIECFLKFMKFLKF